MFRQFLRALGPVRNRLSRTVAGNGAGVPGSNFERNCVSKEEQLTEALKKSLPGTTYISVEDISGGCGAMFEVSIEAKEFIGLPRVKQHRLVTDSLKQEISEMHGIRIHTNPTPTDK
ncbi:hypothetical protein MSG28_004443 [Choristoneura fumiferana]|uniref:Uncharacterized protein n=1 Tax=Choristoneura fumiferana TaxID=7141 RepID=A0ACC0K6V6_CHOFU|nr:hypothetical protein MSG28_004443 [Choristoneura fumiferana]